MTISDVELIYIIIISYMSFHVNRVGTYLKNIVSNL